MEQRRIRVTYKKDGTRPVEAFGYEGPACKAASKFIEEAHGVQDGVVRQKAEWFIENSQSVRDLAEIGVDGTKLCG
jgi:hypothetical protein